MGLLKFILSLPFHLLKFAFGMIYRISQFADAGYYSFGFRENDSEAMRPELEEKGYPVVDTGYVVNGGGGYKYLNDHLIIGGTGEGGGDAITSGKYSIVSGNGSGFGFLGYVLRPFRWIRVYPLIGVGGGGGKQMVFEPQENNPYIPPKNLDDAVTGEMVDPLLVVIGIGVELRLGWLMIGGHFGYRQSPFNSPGTPEKRAYIRMIAGFNTYKVPD